MSSQVQRKLTTILAADADGYSRMMETDEVRALAALQAARSIFAKFIERHHGRIANTAGDGLIAEFPSVVEAVQCAIEVQRELGAVEAGAESGLRFRIGVHLGDVMIDGDDLLGEGVNLAARLQTMAEPGGILISQQVYDQVQKKLSVGFQYLGEKRPKNFAESVAVYSISPGEGVSLDGKGRARQARPARTAKRAGASAPSDLRRRVIRQAMLFGAISGVLLVINLATGLPLWAQWPALALATFLGLRAAPLFSGGWFRLAYARLAVIIAALALINLFTWSGEVWVIWPAAALVVLALIGRLLAGPG
jgi:adenylate cyclase